MMYLYEGRCYSTLEMRTLLEGKGFVDFEIRATTGFRSLIVARKP
jgi:hypothetical protein